MTLKELSEAIHRKQMEKYPNMPPHAIPRKKLSEGSANELTKSILAFFAYKGIKAWRQRSEGRLLARKTVVNAVGQTIEVQKQKYIPGSKESKGIGDVGAVLPPLGRACWVEVKFGKDRLSDDQKKFKSEAEASGAIYIVANNWDSFIFQISKHVKI